MSALGRFTFVPRTVDGSMVGASQNQPTGTDSDVYYEIIDGLSSTNTLGYASGQGAGKRVGVIAYDYINARWSCLFTAGTGITAHQSTTFVNNIQQIKDFITSLGGAPVTLTDEAGNDVAYPRSISSIVS